MKKYLLLATLCLLCCLSFSQTTEFSIKAGSGVFFFSGTTPASPQNLYVLNIYPDYYKVPYGRKPGFSYTTGVSLKHVFANKFVAGANLEFQSLCARSVIDTVVTIYDLNPTITKTPVEGNSYLRNDFIAFSPFFGKRFAFRRFSLDITCGVDIAMKLRGQETINIKKPDYFDKTSKDIPSRSTDTRIRLQADFSIKRFSFFMGYLRGVRNYFTSYEGIEAEGYSNFFTGGIGFHIL